MLDQVQEHRAAVAAYEADIAAAEANIAAAKAALLGKVRDGVDALIAESGLTRAEVLGLASCPEPEKAKARKTPADGRSFPRYALASDPSRVYSRGRMPKWLTDAMAAVNLDPAKPEDREGFRTMHMTVLPA
jgi:DNA-binding protein H-NS